MRATCHQHHRLYHRYCGHGTKVVRMKRRMRSKRPPSVVTGHSLKTTTKGGHTQNCKTDKHSGDHCNSDTIINTIIHTNGTKKAVVFLCWFCPTDTPAFSSPPSLSHTRARLCGWKTIRMKGREIKSKQFQKFLAFSGLLSWRARFRVMGGGGKSFIDKNQATGVPASLVKKTNWDKKTYFVIDLSSLIVPRKYCCRSHAGRPEHPIETTSKRSPKLIKNFLDVHEIGRKISWKRYLGKFWMPRSHLLWEIKLVSYSSCWTWPKCEKVIPRNTIETNRKVIADLINYPLIKKDD